ncbi:hypothetical protein [Leifsonia sp. NPDC058248]|uniref:glycosyltransferase family protein n=1 Tax=Leifsonia sp. NPDC058248 TaxID=3346402 RepID=UPI0036DE5BF7
MKRYLSRLAARLTANRHRLPRWVTRRIDSAIANPNSLAGRLGYAMLGSAASPTATEPPVLSAPTRLYIGPANYAGQGRRWAHAVQSNRPETEAVNMSVAVPGSVLQFESDIVVPLRTYMGDDGWQAAHFDYVTGFTHVLFESGRPLFGERFGPSAFDEAPLVAAKGPIVGMVCHGSDARLPSRHAAAHRWSPFHDRALATPAAERRVAEFLQRLEAFDGPSFVTTPDLLDDVPEGVWCPVVVDVDRWSGGPVPLQRERPVVVHSPSHSGVKGSELIEPAVRLLEMEGLITYRRVEDIAPDAVPEVYRSADIVLDQFRLGSYGVAACEAMAAGRVVLGHVTNDVRDRVREETDAELPIVEATPDTIADVLRSVIADREAARATAEASSAFARDVHDGRRSAHTLSTNLLSLRR